MGFFSWDMISHDEATSVFFTRQYFYNIFLVRAPGPWRAGAIGRAGGVSGVLRVVVRVGVGGVLGVDEVADGENVALLRHYGRLVHRHYVDHFRPLCRWRARILIAYRRN